MKKLFLLLTLLLTLLPTIALAQYYSGKVGSTIYLPEPTPPAGWIAVKWTYHTTSEHLSVYEGSNAVTIDSYFTGHEVVTCYYKCYYDDGDYPVKDGKQSYYISCTGDPGSGGGGGSGGGTGGGTTSEWISATTRTIEGVDIQLVRHMVGSEWYVRSINSDSKVPSISKSTTGTVTIPNSYGGYEVLGVSSRAFYDCRLIDKVVIPNTVKYLSNTAFWDCGISEVEFGNSVLSIDSYTFRYCPNLKEVVLPSSVKYIRNCAFDECDALETITIPANLEELGYSAFSCKNIKTVINLSPTPLALTNNPFYSTIYNNATLYVPKGSKTKYENADYWKNFKTIVEGTPTDQNVLVNKITINPTSGTLKVNETMQLSATVSPSDATDKSVTWSSNNTSVASVSTTGLVTAKAVGSAIITCKANDGSGVSASCSVKVESATVEPTSISLPSSKTIKVGESFTMSYTLYPSNATTTLTWTSDNSQIASVSSYGVVTGVKAGSTYINVRTANGRTAYCKVTVEASTVEPSSVGVKSVSAGFSHSLILKEDGSLLVCGENSSGQLGDGTTADRHTPKKIMDGVSSASAGLGITLIVKDDGSLWTCGHNYDGQLGDGTTVGRNTPIKIMAGVSSVAAGYYHNLIVKNDGSLWACGYNYDGRLGDGTTTSRYTPVKIMDGVSSVVAGESHSLIVKNDGSLWACGDNYNGQFGDGTTTGRHTPVKIMDGVSSVSAESFHSLIVKNDGSLWACGRNVYGQLGDGTTTERHTPVKIMDGVSSVSAGYDYSLIVKNDGSLWSCGYNKYGQLGDGTTTDRNTPIKIMNGVSSVSAGYDYSLIVKNDGSIWACGYNARGQLGDGTTTDRTIPVMIMAGSTYNQTCDITLSNAGYGTFYDSKNNYVLPEELSASVVTSCYNDKLTFRTIADGKTAENVIPKGTAVMIENRVKSGGKYTLTSTTNSATYAGTNYLYGSDNTTMTSASGDNYYYKLTYGNGGNSNVFGWYWGSRDGSAFTIDGHKAWLALPKSSISSRSFSAEGEATDIRIFIGDEGDATYYDLQGRAVGSPARTGLYIKNGKKVVVNKKQ